MADENNNTKTCPHDCLQCSTAQQLFCAANLSRITHNRMEEMSEQFELMKDKFNKLTKGSEGVFNPMDE